LETYHLPNIGNLAENCDVETKISIERYILQLPSRTISSTCGTLHTCIKLVDGDQPHPWLTTA